MSRAFGNAAAIIADNSPGAGTQIEHLEARIRRERQQFERRVIEIVEAWNQFAAHKIIGVSPSYQRLANCLGHPMNVPIVSALSESIGWPGTVG